MGVVGTNIYIIGTGGGVTTQDLPTVLKDFYAQNGGTGKIILKWDFKNTENLTGVYICYQADEYPTSPNDGVKVVVDNYTTLSVDIENLKNGVEYFFRAYPYREIDGVKYFQTCNETCKTVSTPNNIVTPADLEIDGNCFVEIPKCTWADLGINDSEETFPAFIIDGKEVDSIFIGKYCGDVENDKAISKTGCKPTTVKFETAKQYCENIGTGWHLITRLEWMAIANWSVKNNCIPLSITNLNITPTGAYNVSYSHNGSEDGIFEMDLAAMGTFNAGIRFCGRELQVISRNGSFANDAANSSIDQTATSKYWYAIDGTTGELIIPDGKGTTEKSIKGNGAKWDILSTSILNTKISTVTCADSICDRARNILLALGLLPSSNTVPATILQVNNGLNSNAVIKSYYYLGMVVIPESASSQNTSYYRPVFYTP